MLPLASTTFKGALAVAGPRRGPMEETRFQAPRASMLNMPLATPPEISRTVALRKGGWSVGSPIWISKGAAASTRVSPRALLETNPFKLR